MRFLSHGQALEYVAREAGLSRETFDLNIRPRLVERKFSERVSRFSKAAIDHAIRDPLFVEHVGCLYDLDRMRERAAAFKRQPGVYFLFNAGELVYIGQSWNVAARLADHQPGVHGDAEKPWDAFVVQEFDADRLVTMEAHFLTVFAPKYNRARR